LTGSQASNSSDQDPTNASAIAMLTEAEANGLESILNTLEPRVEVAKEALRLYTTRAEKLQKRLDGIEQRRKQLASVGNTLPQVLKYVGDIRVECQTALTKVDPPNLAIINILKKQHSEALQRLARNTDTMIALKLEVAELESQLRESRVNAIRTMHGTASGTTERLAQLRALRAAEVVQNQINGIETECESLRTSLINSYRQNNNTSHSGNNDASPFQQRRYLGGSTSTGARTPLS
jgi:chromosome segregation ATPase